MRRTFKQNLILGALVAWSALSACSSEDPPPVDAGGGEVDMGAHDMPGPGGDMAEGDGGLPGDMGPVIEEGARLEGLSAPVQARIDEHGVVHLRCQTNLDCFEAQGYYHAAHRFAQMDLRRRVGSGRIAELLKLFNQNALDSDMANRSLLTSSDGRPLEEVYLEEVDEETRAALEAYTRGVNGWLADLAAERNGATLSEEYGFALLDTAEIPPWTPQDSVVVGLVFLNGLVNNSGNELAAGSRLDEMPEALFLDAHLGWHVEPGTTVIEAAGEEYTGPGSLTALRGPARLPGAQELGPLREALRPASAALQKAHERIEAAMMFRGEGPFGSNNWATAPAANAADHAILSNDPHLGLSSPAVWYLIEMDATSGEGAEGDLHAAGVSFAGLPGIMIGFSEEVAWSATVAYWDLADTYIETLSPDGQGVMFNGQVVPFIKKSYTFAHANGETTREFLYVPHHGPVLSIDRAAGTAISLRTKVEEAADDLALFINMGRASSLDEARQTLATSTAAGFSFVLIDRQGSIAYYPFASIPRREWDVVAHPAWLPLPGTGEYEWSGDPIDADELPQLRNPPADFIATANAGITDDMLDGFPGNDGYPPLQTAFLAPGVRQAQIIKVLQANKGQHDLASHAALQGDTAMWLAAELLPEILTAVAQAPLSADATALQMALAAWDYTCPTGLDGADPAAADKLQGPEAASSIGCSAFHALLHAAGAQALGDELNDTGLSGAYEIAMLYLLMQEPGRLHGGALYWDDVSTPDTVETPAEILAAAMEQAATDLEAHFGSSDPDDWRWGRVHTLTLRPDLLSLVTDVFDNGPYAAPGGLYTVNVANPRRPTTGDYSFGSGPSMRMIVEGKASGMEAYFQLPGGQVHHVDSPHYDDLLDDWLVNDHFRMPFTAAEVDQAASTVIMLRPQE